MHQKLPTGGEKNYTEHSAGPSRQAISLSHRLKPGDETVYSSGKIKDGRFTLKKENRGSGETITLTSCEGLPELEGFLNRTTTKAEVISGKTEDRFTLWLHVNLPLAGNFKWRDK